MDEKCGCKIFINDIMKTWSINYCPLHAAAPLMLEACKVLTEQLAHCLGNTNKAVEQGRAAIAAAQPKEVE